MGRGGKSAKWQRAEELGYTYAEYVGTCQCSSTTSRKIEMDLTVEEWNADTERAFDAQVEAHRGSMHDLGTPCNDTSRVDIFMKSWDKEQREVIVHDNPLPRLTSPPPPSAVNKYYY